MGYLAEIRDWLIAQDATLDGKLFIGKRPDLDECAALYESGGDPDPYSTVEHMSFKVIVQGADRAESLGLANTIFDLLRSSPSGGALDQDLTNWHVYIVIAKRPQHIGVDDNNRPLFAFDCEAILRPIN